jgi:hypothetical protein
MIEIISKKKIIYLKLEIIFKHGKMTEKIKIKIKLKTKNIILPKKKLQLNLSRFFSVTKFCR